MQHVTRGYDVLSRPDAQKQPLSSPLSLDMSSEIPPSL